MYYSNFDITKQIYGRRLITTDRNLIGNSSDDSNTIIEILNESLPIHNDNAKEETNLFNIFFNSEEYWVKEKTQRSDINNKVTVPSAWALSRTLNFYCFGEPIKYISRTTSDNGVKQSLVEELSEMLDYQHNHDSVTMATLSSSICGLGYKLALPASADEYNFSGVPFTINGDFIYPQNAFCVYSNDAIKKKVIGVLIGTHYDKNNLEDGKEYTVWTKNSQYKFIETTETNGIKLVPVIINGEKYAGYPIFSNAIPLIEVERNAFRKGDWEVAIDLLKIKNKLISDRADDVDQILDYVLVLINCAFKNDEDKKKALTERIFEIEQRDGRTNPDLKILKNELQQDGIQVLCDYIDLLIQECVGIPNRSERGGGGHDTGKAVMYRNGFRDLENNAGMIIPKMDKAETEFIGVCISYASVFGKLNGLKPFDVRNKFIRTMSDDPSTTSTAYYTFRKAGMNDIDSLIASKAVTDASEVAQNNEFAMANNKLLFQMENQVNGQQGEKPIE